MILHPGFCGNWWLLWSSAWCRTADLWVLLTIAACCCTSNSRFLLVIVDVERVSPSSPVSSSSVRWGGWGSPIVGVVFPLSSCVGVVGCLPPCLRRCVLRVECFFWACCPWRISGEQVSPCSIFFFWGDVEGSVYVALASFYVFRDRNDLVVIAHSEVCSVC